MKVSLHLKITLKIFNLNLHFNFQSQILQATKT